MEAFGFLVLMILFCRLRPGCFAGGESVLYFPPVFCLFGLGPVDFMPSGWKRSWGFECILGSYKGESIAVGAGGDPS